MVFIVYATVSIILQVVINMVNRYEIEFIMTQLKINNYIKIEVMGQLEVLTAIV